MIRGDCDDDKSMGFITTLKIADIGTHRLLEKKRKVENRNRRRDRAKQGAFVW